MCTDTSTGGRRSPPDTPRLTQGPQLQPLEQQQPHQASQGSCFVEHQQQHPGAAAPSSSSFSENHCRDSAKSAAGLRGVSDGLMRRLTPTPSDRNASSGETQDIETPRQRDTTVTHNPLVPAQLCERTPLPLGCTLSSCLLVCLSVTSQQAAVWPRWLAGCRLSPLIRCLSNIMRVSAAASQSRSPTAVSLRCRREASLLRLVEPLESGPPPPALRAPLGFFFWSPRDL